MTDQTPYADDDPEYADDAAAHEDAEDLGLTPADPSTLPPDRGDAGQARVA
jgi:hypothetical protein